MITIVTSYDLVAPPIIDGIVISLGKFLNTILLFALYLPVTGVYLEFDLNKVVLHIAKFFELIIEDLNELAGFVDCFNITESNFFNDFAVVGDGEQIISTTRNI